MDPVTISHEARLRYDEIMEETGIIRKNRYPAPVSFGLWRWVRRTIANLTQPVQADSQETSSLHERPVHAGGRSK